MTKHWQYLVTTEGSTHMESNLKGLGEMGWELVSVTHSTVSDRYTLFFKREVVK